MTPVTLSVRTHPDGEVLLEGFETVLPVTIGREGETDLLSLSTGDEGQYALDHPCPGVSRTHATVDVLETGHVVLRDSSTNGVFLYNPDRAAVPVGKQSAWPIPAGQTAFQMSSVIVEIKLSEDAIPDGEAPADLLSNEDRPVVSDPKPDAGAVAPPSEPDPVPEPEPEPAAPAAPALREVALTRTQALVMVDETDTETELHEHAVVISSGAEGLGLKLYPMARIEDLLEQPVSAERSLVAAIGATETGDLCLAASAAEEPVKINRGRLSPGSDPRLLSALDTIEIAGRVLRVTERNQRFLICDNCGMSNPYAHTENCAHCGTRLINSVTRIVN